MDDARRLLPRLPGRGGGLSESIDLPFELPESARRSGSERCVLEPFRPIELLRRTFPVSAEEKEPSEPEVALRGFFRLMKVIGEFLRGFVLPLRGPIFSASFREKSLIHLEENPPDRVIVAFEQSNRLLILAFGHLDLP